MKTIGKKRWAIAEGYIPEGSHGPEPEMTSHETVCILNATDKVAQVQSLFFSLRVNLAERSLPPRFVIGLNPAQL